MDLLEVIMWLWTNGLVIPMTNFLVLLSRISFGNFGVAIIIFTLIMRAVTWPLSQSQLRATRAMQVVQPRIQEIQKKHKDPKRRSEETMKLYREAGVNPLGCIWPMLVQFPIWIALYQTIIQTLGSTPERLLRLADWLYPWSFVERAVPLSSHFLWMDLGQPDIIMPFLVGASMWVQQKMITPPATATDSQQQSMNRMMLWMMPLFFGWITLTVPSGLALYWAVSNVASIAMQYAMFGWGTLNWRQVVPIGVPAASPPRRQQEVVVSAADGPNKGEKRVYAKRSRSRRKNR